MKAVLLLCIVIGMLDSVSTKDIVIGALLKLKGSPTNQFSVYRVGPALQIALDDFEARGGLPGHSVRFVVRNSHCDATDTIKTIRNAMSKGELAATIGPGCTSNVESSGLFLSIWNIPFLTYGAGGAAFADVESYSTLVRLRASTAKMTPALITMFKEYKWTHAVIVSSLGNGGERADHIVKEFPKSGINIGLRINIKNQGGALPKHLIQNILTSIEQRGRVVLVAIGEEDVANLMIEAFDRGMTKGSYIFIRFTPVTKATHKVPWVGNNLRLTHRQQTKIKSASLVFKTFSIAEEETTKTKQFFDAIPERLLEPPWNTNFSLVNNIKGSTMAIVIYECMYTYLSFLNDTLHGPDPTQYNNGTFFLQQVKGKTFIGLDRDVQFDQSGDREASFWLWSMAPGEDRFKGVSTFTSSGEVHHFAPMYWNTPDGLPPPDTPPCGFRNELCPDPNRKYFIIGGSVGSVLVVIAAVIAVQLLRRQHREAVLKRMLWKILFPDITMLNKTLSRRSMQSGVSDLDDAVYAAGDVGLYRGTMVTVCKFETCSVKLRIEDYIELNEMKDMRHGNINKFVGACIDAPDICGVMSYCEKGNIRDILDNEEIHLDWMLKSSIISDLTNGMIYLHQTGLGSHGNLKSTNCMLDSRWVVKVSGYGMHSLRGRAIKEEELGNEDYFSDLSWMAPEFLRMEEQPRNGSQKGDVYSFGVILQELVYRAMPLFMDEAEPKEVIAQLKHQQDSAFRPALPELEDDTHPNVPDLISLCWAEDPDDRPTFNDVKANLMEMNQGREIDIMEMMVKRMEGYAANLEEIVAKRTEELTEEKEKTEVLLFQMLPRSVVEKLVAGERVQPEMFEAVTIYFSDIVGFTSISAGSTSMQVVDLLNDLYTLFDGILTLHDVYKVETVGDAYMVVSGLPVRNGNRHAAQIANMSLDLVSAVTHKARIRHRPDMKMRLRSGFHTGAAAAGVVGVKMPRYCLFGQTVLYASKMESSGQASQVQCSQESYDMLAAHGGYQLEEREAHGIQEVPQPSTYWLRGKDEVVLQE